MKLLLKLNDFLPLKEVVFERRNELAKETPI